MSIARFSVSTQTILPTEQVHRRTEDRKGVRRKQNLPTHPLPHLPHNFSKHSATNWSTRVGNFGQHVLDSYRGRTMLAVPGLCQRDKLRKKVVVRVLFGGIAGGWLNFKGARMLFDVLTSYVYDF